MYLFQMNACDVVGFCLRQNKDKNNTKCVIKRECFITHDVPSAERHQDWMMHLFTEQDLKNKRFTFLLHDVGTLCGNTHAQSAVFFSYKLFKRGKKVC